MKSIFKNVNRKIRSIQDVNPEKYPKKNQHHIIDLIMELHVQIVNGFKLSTIFAKHQIL